MSRVRGTVVVALTGALVLGLCGTASAATTARSASVNVPSFVPLTPANVSCAAGEHVGAAGFSAAANDDSGVWLTGLAPTPTTLKATSINAGDPGLLTATAYCTSPDKAAKKKKKKKKKKKGKGKSASSSQDNAVSAKKGKKKKKKKKKKQASTPPPTQVASVSTIPAGANTGTATVTCPSGTTVRAAGFDTASTEGDIYFLSSLTSPTPTTVKIDVERWPFPDDPIALTAIALCGSGPALTAVPGNEAVVPNDGTATSTATCPSGTKVAYMGYSDNSTGTYPTGLTRVSDTVATATAYDRSSAADRVQVTAYCG
jgi:outer membrane biosynthesis protein TonB